MSDTVERQSGRAEQISHVVVRFAGDSGDGMQLTGDRFTSASALFGNDLSTFPDYPAEICSVYESRRDALVDGLARIGWHIPKPEGTMFVWAPIPPEYEELKSLEFAKLLVREAHVAVSPGVGFGPGGEGFVRFALIENEQRIQQAIRGIRRALPKLVG